jgi:16S rRNA processing protein RimM
MPDLPVGRLVGLFGIRGELKCDPSGAGRTLFLRGASFEYAMADGSRRDVKIGSVREHKGRYVVTLDGVESADAAQAYVGGTFYAPRERVERELEEGEHLDVDLIGCSLFGPDGTVLGKVEDVRHYPSSDMLIVGGKMVPMVKAFVRGIDTADKRIDVDLPPGLLDDGAEEA